MKYSRKNTNNSKFSGIKLPQQWPISVKILYFYQLRLGRFNKFKFHLAASKVLNMASPSQCQQRQVSSFAGSRSWPTATHVWGTKTFYEMAVNWKNQFVNSHQSLLIFVLGTSSFAHSILYLIKIGEKWVKFRQTIICLNPVKSAESEID